MNGFLYWTDSQESISDLSKVAALGLSYAFDGVHSAPFALPDVGKPGHIFCRKEVRPKFAPQQTWKQIPKPLVNDADVWIGFGDLPTPQELARPTQLQGHTVTVDDGTQWLIPVARKWHIIDEQPMAGCALPPKLELSSEGEWLPTAVKERYSRLWALCVAYESAYAQAYVEALAEHDGPQGTAFSFTVDFDDWDALAIEAIKTNYYVADAEVNALGWFDYQSQKAIVAAVTDEPTWKAWSQKKTLAQPGSTSSNGPTASTPEPSAGTVPA